MKIPPYISKGDIINTIKLGHEIRNKDGISTYLLFKKLCTVGMYGEMITCKIKYHALLSEIRRYWDRNNTFIGFWEYDRVKRDSTSKVFMIQDTTIKFGTMYEVEREIYNKIIFNKDVILDKRKLNMLYEPNTEEKR